jgi:hypothetical protein
MRTLCCLCLAASAIVAQSAVVPASPSGDANSAALVGGFDGDHRHQFLFDGSLLVGLRNRALLGLAFRRDAGSERAYAGGEADLRITLSTVTHSALAANEVMDRNLDPLPANRVVVFDGRVVLPPSAATPGRIVSWSDPQDVVEITFTTPFPYAGGTLVVDVVGTQVPGRATPYWAVDAHADPVSGSAIEVGESCARFGGRADPSAPFTSAHVAPRDLVAGFTAVFHGLGDPGAMAAWLVGFSPTIVDLHALGIGAPGCRLYVADAFAVSGTFVDRSAYGLPGGEARLALQVPVAPSLLGGRFRAQLAQIGTPVRTSNAIDCKLAARLPALGMATVEGPVVGGVAPVRGRVMTSKGPVIRFRY